MDSDKRKLLAVRQAESTAAYLAQQKREENAREYLDQARCILFSDVIEALDKAGIDPVRLRDWLEYR